MDYMPPEIVALIAEYLYADDIYNLRLSARYLRAYSDPVFIKRYFQQRIHLLSRDSLVTLLTISSLPKFGRSIEEIHLSSNHLIPDYICNHPALFESIPRPFWCSAPQGIFPETGWESYLIDDKCFQERGSDIICLNRILKKTSNCHTIVLNGWDRPWGAGTARRKTGFFPTSSAVWDDTSDFIEEAIHLIIGALATSDTQITTLKFETALEQRHMHPRMLDFPEFYLDKDLPWITSLKNLSLVVDPDYGDDPQLWAKRLSDFIMRFPRVENLDLQFNPNLEQAGTAALKQMLILPTLRTFQLSGINCSSEDLLDFFQIHHNTLQEVFLDSVSLDAGTSDPWRSLLAAIRDRFSLVSFRMARCFITDEQIWVEEGDSNISNDILVTGGDPQLYDRLIQGLRKGLADFPDKSYIIS